MPRAVDGLKVCSRKDCALAGQPQPVEAYNRDAQRPDGLRPACKLCTRRTDSARRDANPERERLRHKARYAANPELERRRSKAWRDANPELQRRRSKAWRDANPEYSSLKAAAWRVAHPGYAAAWCEANPQKVAAKYQRRRARLDSAGGGSFNTGRDDYRARILYYGARCAYCDGKAETLDHAIPVSRGGSNWPANIRPACRACNLSKGSKLLYREWTPPKDRAKLTAA